MTWSIVAASIAVLFALVATMIWWIARHLAMDRALAAPACGACEHLLPPATGERCLECGAWLPDAQVAPAGWLPPLVLRLRWIAVVLGTCALLLVVWMGQALFVETGWSWSTSSIGQFDNDRAQVDDRRVRIDVAVEVSRFEFRGVMTGALNGTVIWRVDEVDADAARSPAGTAGDAARFPAERRYDVRDGRIVDAETGADVSATADVAAIADWLIELDVFAEGAQLAMLMKAYVAGLGSTGISAQGITPAIEREWTDRVAARHDPRSFTTSGYSASSSGGMFNRPAFGVAPCLLLPLILGTGLFLGWRGQRAGRLVPFESVVTGRRATTDPEIVSGDPTA